MGGAIMTGPSYGRKLPNTTNTLVRDALHGLVFGNSTPLTPGLSESVFGAAAVVAIATTDDDGVAKPFAVGDYLIHPQLLDYGVELCAALRRAADTIERKVAERAELAKLSTQEPS